MSTVMLFSILDTKSQVYGPIMSFINQQTAYRSFQEMLISGDKNSLLSLYPTDYSLFVLGSFDNVTGKFEIFPAPTIVCTGFEACTKAIEEAEKRRNFQSKLQGVREANNLPNSDGVVDYDALNTEIPSELS